MIFYGIVFSLYMVFAVTYCETKNRLFALMGMVLLVAIAAFRGDVGTDTWVYNNYYDDIRVNGCGAGELEPIFCIYSWGLSKLFESNKWINLFNAVIIAFLLYVPLLRNQPKHAVVILIIVPVVYLDFAMNGVRAGLAYSLLFAFTSRSLYRVSRRPRTAMALATVVATGVHLSTVFLAGLQYLVVGRLSAMRLLSMTLGLILVLLAATTVIQPLLLVRALASLESEPFSALSGYAPAAANLALLAIGASVGALRSRKAIILLAVLNVLSLVLARYTYNGIRVLQLLYFVESVLICTFMRRRLTHLHLIVIVVLVSLTLALKVRNWVNESEVGATPTPFIPYQTIFGW